MILKKIKIILDFLKTFLILVQGLLILLSNFLELLPLRISLLDNIGKIEDSYNINLLQMEEGWNHHLSSTIICQLR